MLRVSHVLGAALAISLVHPLVCRAQMSPEGTISGNGVVTLKPQPGILRLQVDLTAEGKDMKDALAKLKEAQNAIKPQVLSLGASEASVSFQTPRVGNATNDRRQQMERMMRSRMAKKATTAGAPGTPVTLTTTLKAEWPRKSAAAEEMLVTSQELKQKVQAIIKAASRTNAASEEEREEAEGSPDMSNMPYDDGSPKPGEPMIIFVGKVSDDELAKATADAFKKAKDEAARLAKAAGAELGALRMLSGQAAFPSMDESYGGYNPYYQRLMYMAAQQQRGGGDASREAVGMDPGSVKMDVTVMASFGIK